MNFSFNDKSCEYFGLELISSNHLTIPSKKIEIVAIPGRTGSLVIDDGSRENLTIDITCLLQTNSNMQIQMKHIGDWLLNPIGYCSLNFSDGSRFKAVCIGNIEVSKITNSSAEIKLKFSATQA